MCVWVFVGEFLQGRSWQGLEARLGETEVVRAAQGSTGLAASYQHEPPAPPSPYRAACRTACVCGATAACVSACLCISPSAVSERSEQGMVGEREGKQYPCSNFLSNENSEHSS